MKENELIKAVDSIYGVGKDKQNNEVYSKKKQDKNISDEFDKMLKIEQEKLKEKDEQLERLKQKRAYINILHNIYEEENSKITKNR